MASEISSHRLRTGNAFGDYAVLYRGNFQSRAFEKAMRERQIPYRVSGGRSFFERSEIRDLAAYLKLLVNPDDDAAFLRVVNLPRRDAIAGKLRQLLPQRVHDRFGVFGFQAFVVMSLVVVPTVG